VALELHPGEQVIFEGHPSWRGTLGFYLKGLVLVAVGAAIVALATTIGDDFSLDLTILGAVVLLLLVLLAGFVKRASTHYAITDQRLTIRRGILSRRVQETRVERVQNVNTSQSLLERVLRVGKVDFDTAGSDDADFVFEDVADPARVVRAVDEAHRARETAARQASIGGGGGLPGGL
jgi:uncharacterized membrane protein YdbT with pleckstrin-like domain